MFVITIATIFFGWVLSGLVNIWFGKWCNRDAAINYEVKDRTLTTWFPAFRANYEVAQVVSGGKKSLVFWSSVKVKFLASLFIAVVVLILAQKIDVSEISNDEGFATLYISASVMLVVGGMQLKWYYKSYG
jgi:hypothetical protein